MRHSRSKDRNKAVVDWSEGYKKKDNLEFFKDALTALSKDKAGNSGLMTIGLLGQRDIPGHTLRTAQSVLRWDARPSLWSHVFLISDPVNPGFRNLGETPIREVTLHARSGMFPKPEDNGVHSGVLGLYRNPKVDANVALLAVRMSDKDARNVSARAHNPNVDRVRFDLWEMLGVWEGYLWSHGARPNPLREGVPIPSSSYVEMAFEAIQLDLTPGSSERNSAPEHIWNAAVWWHEALKSAKHEIRGYYVLRDKGASLLSTDD